MVGESEVFGKKGDAGSLKIAEDFQGSEIEFALTGEWMTLALATFRSTFTTRQERDNFDYCVAKGVVHFDYGTSRLIPAKLTLVEERPEQHGLAGSASFQSRRAFAGQPAYILMDVQLYDPFGKIARALRDAFFAIAASQDRFVHVALRREKLNPSDHLPKLREKGYGAYHDIIAASVASTILLPAAPAWSWRWDKDSK